eukprot:TRINITY_DN2078_c3_g1_i1.p1 TRINITY_DN2078_c3_g1~~TRINITY_DN2078_c3_g1_i1.p1  ORF type:complete len:263 (+),score=56.51 TRINITY_DN2078_c3_g1_i1:106-894(+)
MSVPRLGQKLSLISKSSIKYEGTLADINAAANTLTLSSVTMYGTEERPAATFVPKSDQLFEFIVFRGNDIKDLTVYPDSNMPPADPAIVTAGPPRPQHQSGHHAPNRGPPMGHHNNYHKDRVTAVPDYRQPRYDGGHNRHHGGGGGRGGGGGYNNRYGRRGGGKGYNRNSYASHTGLEFASSAPAGKREEMKEFDFEAMQKQVEEFEKEKSQNVNPAYKKESSFFDTLSKADITSSRSNDTDTFGEGARGRGNFRGGRGRGR